MFQLFQSNEEPKSKKAKLDPPTTQAEIPLTSNNVTPNKIAVTVDSLTANVVDNTVNGCSVVNPGIQVLHHQPPSINTGIYGISVKISTISTIMLLLICLSIFNLYACIYAVWHNI